MRSSTYSQRRSRRGRVAAVLFTSVALVAACSSTDAPPVRPSSSSAGPAAAKAREYLGEPTPRTDGVTVVLLLAGAVSFAVAQRAVRRLS